MMRHPLLAAAALALLAACSANSGEAGAAVTIRATGSGAYAGVTIDKVFTLAKSLAGTDGADAKLLFVTSDRQTIAYDGAGSPTPWTT